MWAAFLVIVLASIPPGLALTRILDGAADTFRKSLLCLPLGLLVLYGTSGILFVIQIWSIISLTVSILILEIVSLLFLRRKIHIEKTQHTHWQRLEAAMHGLVLSESEPELEEEVQAQRWFQQQRNPMLQILAGLFCAMTLTPLLLLDRPFGVDWVGFGTLAANIQATGSFELPSPNSGLWTYPPAFPSLLAWLSELSGSSIEQSAMLLGHVSLLAILFGIWGSMDRLGAGASSVLAMGGSLALFAKVFDSGYPSVASQLGLIVGLLVVFRPYHSSLRSHIIAFISTAGFTVLIHPTGAIYLACMLLASILMRKSMDEGEQDRSKHVFFSSIIIMSVMFIVALIFFAPRMLEEPVFAEYGWQGGKPMLMYNGPLMILAAYGLWLGRKSKEIRLLSLWLGTLWILSFVHLIDGLTNVQILSLMSYTLYSMALHAYHVPLALIVGLIASRSTSLASVDGEKAWLNRDMDPYYKPIISSICLTALIVGSILTAGLFVQLSQHQELHASTSGDERLRIWLEDNPPDSIIYSENIHWGHTYSFATNIETSSIPTLGLLTLNSEIQQDATSAIRNDDISRLRELNIGYAVSSPIGSLAPYLATSPHWSVEKNYDGARYWKLHDAPSPSHVAVVSSLSHGTCIEASGCDLNQDPWRNHRYGDLLSLGDNRMVMTKQGQIDWNGAIDDVGISGRFNVCLLYEQIGTGLDYSIQFNQVTISPDDKSGWRFVCAMVQFERQLDVSINLENDGEWWINPLGFSGRGEHIIDSTGLRIHHFEVLQAN